MVACAFSPSTRETEAGRSLLRLDLRVRLVSEKERKERKERKEEKKKRESPVFSQLW